MNNLFELRGEVNRKTSIYLMIGGVIFIILIWHLLSLIIPSLLFASPLDTMKALPELFQKDRLVKNLAYSIRLNLMGYLEAIAISIPLGYVLGLWPLFREAFSRQIVAIRFLALTALVGVFITWFGIGDTMKVHFLALGIVVFLLPATKDEIEKTPVVYVDAIRTLGASPWQEIRYVHIPIVMSRLFSQIISLVSLSWTYIIIVEVVNSSAGGIGALSYIASRQGRVDKVFCILLLIIIIGILQDFLFKYLDKLFFPHKYKASK